MTVMVTNRLVTPQPVPSVKTKVMGVDPSTHTGVVILDGVQVLHVAELNFPGSVGYTRLQLIADRVSEIAKAYNPERIMIEMAISSGKFNNMIQQRISTLIRDRLFTAGRAWMDVSPTTLKKWTTGSGKADKKGMLKAVAARWGFSHKSDNIVDGFALAKLGQIVGDDPSSMIKGVLYGSEGLQA